MREEEFYRNKIAENVEAIKSLDRLIKVYTVATTLLRCEKEKAAEHGLQETDNRTSGQD